MLGGCFAAAFLLMGLSRDSGDVELLCPIFMPAYQIGVAVGFLQTLRSLVRRQLGLLFCSAMNAVAKPTR